MKRKLIPCLLALALTASLAPSVLAATPPAVCYPSAVTRSEDGTEIRKVYDLSPEEDPAGIPRSDFEQDGFHYTLTDLLRQEAPEYEERYHTETVTVNSKSKDLESVLTLLPQTKEFTTDDGLTGILALKLETVNVEVSGYGSTTKNLSATRTYPGLSSQDTSNIPKSIEDSGHTLTLQAIDWRTEGDERYTAVAAYTGTATSSYVKGYTVTADYSGAVSRIVLNKVRYVAIFEGVSLTPVEQPTPEPTPEPEPEPTPEPDVPATEAPAFRFHWAYVLVPLGVIAAIGGGVGVALFIKKRGENDTETEDDSE